MIDVYDEYVIVYCRIHIYHGFTRTILQTMINDGRVGSLHKIHLPPTWTDMAVLVKPSRGVGLDAGHEEVEELCALVARSQVLWSRVLQEDLPVDVDVVEIGPNVLVEYLANNVLVGVDALLVEASFAVLSAVMMSVGVGVGVGAGEK